MGYVDFLKYTAFTLGPILITSCGSSDSDKPKAEIPPTKTTEEINAIRNETVNDFFKKNPEYKGRTPSVINFRVDTVNADTIAFASTEAEKAIISDRKLKIGEVEVTPYTDAIVWTLQTNPDFSEEWVQLSGAQYKLDDTGEIITVWYSPKGVDGDGNIEHQKVLAFKSGASEYVFYPLVEPPQNILWSDTLITQEKSEFKPWDGIQPFVLPTAIIENGPGKSGLMAIAPEIEVSEEFKKVQEEISGTKTYTLTPNGIEYDGPGDEPVETVKDIKPNIANGTFIITVDGKEVVTVLKEANDVELILVDLNNTEYNVVAGEFKGIRPTPSEEFIKVQEKFGESRIYTLMPEAIEMLIDGEVMPIENIKPNITDGSFIIVIDGDEYIANLKFIDEPKITFRYKDGNIVWDGESLKLIPFEIMELSSDPNNPTICSSADYFSGQVAWNERRNAKPFPEGTTSAHWGNSKIAGNGSLFLQPGNEQSIKLSSICRITGDFLETEYQYDIVGVQVLNKDGSIGFLHFLADRRTQYYNTNYILKQIETGEIGIRKENPESELIKFQNDTIYGPMTRLYKSQGGNQRIKDLIIEMILSGAIPDEMETVILTHMDYNPKN